MRGPFHVKQFWLQSLVLTNSNNESFGYIIFITADMKYSTNNYVWTPHCLIFFGIFNSTIIKIAIKLMMKYFFYSCLKLKKFFAFCIANVSKILNF